MRAPDTRTSTSSGWMIGANLIGIAFQGLYFIFVARALGAEQFGIFAGAFALVVILATFSGVGSGNVLVMRVSRARDTFQGHYGTAWTYILVSAIPLGLIALALAVPSGEAFVLTAIPLLASELVFGRFIDLSFQVFQSHDRLRGTALLNVLAGGTRMAVAGAFLLWVDGDSVTWAWFLAGANFLLAATGIALSWAAFGGPRVNAGYLRSNWKDGIFFALGMSSRTAYLDADKYILNLNNLEQSAGVYSAGSRLITMAFSPVQAIVYSANTRLFRAGVEGRDAVWRVARTLLVRVLAYAVFAAAALALGAPIVPLILGADYDETARLLPFLAPILIFQSVHYVFGDSLMGLGKQSVRSIAQAAVAVAAVLVNLWLIPLYGLPAAIVVSVSASLVLAILMITLFVFQKRTPAP